jgi:hypothetical protein
MSTAAADRSAIHYAGAAGPSTILNWRTRPILHVGFLHPGGDPDMAIRLSRSDLLSSLSRSDLLRLLSHEKVRRAEAPKHFELRPITMIHRSLCRQYVALSAAVSTVS